MKINVLDRAVNFSNKKPPAEVIVMKAKITAGSTKESLQTNHRKFQRK